MLLNCHVLYFIDSNAGHSQSDLIIQPNSISVAIWTDTIIKQPAFYEIEGNDLKIYDFSTGNEQEQIFIENCREKTEYDSTSLFACSAYLDQYDGDSCLWHWHDELEAGYVKEGSLKVSVNDQTYTLQKGDGIFINAGVLHAYSGVEQVQTYYPNLVFLPSLVYGSKESVYWVDYVQPLVCSVSFTHLILSKQIVWQAQALECVERALELFVPAPSGREFEIREYLSKLLLLICRNHLLGDEQVGSGQAQIMLIRKMLEFMERHYMEPIQLQHIAESAFISSRECLRLFKNVIGTSPKQYLMQLRMKKAKYLLEQTTVPISEICACCGFQDQSYFSKMFRRQFGSSPARFRKEGTKSFQNC